MNKVLRGNIYFLIIILISVFGGIITVPIIKALGITNIGYTLMLNHVMLFLVPALIYMLITRSNFKKTFRLNKLSLKNVGFIILLAILVQPIMSLCSLISAYFFPNNVAEFVGQISDMTYWQMLLIMAVTPAITEEVTIRGVILSNYDEVSPIKAAVITGILFGIFHMSPQQFLYATLLGILMAYLVRITNSIFSSVLIHFLINGWSVTLQKLMTKLTEILNMEEAVKQASETTITLQDLLITGTMFAVFSVAAGTLIFLILRHMTEKQSAINMAQPIQEVSNMEGTVRGNDRKFKDSIVNYIPIFVSLIIYVGYVALDLFLRSKM